MAASDGMLFRCGSYEGCISGSDVGKERRPYHRNCGCALHNRSESKKFRQNSQNNQCLHVGQKTKSVSYPLRRAWSEGNLGLMVANNGSYCGSGQTSPSMSPAAVRQQPLRHHRLGSVGSLSAFDEEEEEEEELEDCVFLKVRMSISGVCDIMLKCCVFEESLSIQKTEIERRPYHKNCKCALHKSNAAACSNNARPKRTNISLLKKQSSHESLRISASKAPSKFSSSKSSN